MKLTPPGPQLLPVKGVLRFALGSATGLRSNTWSVTGGKTTDDVYLAAREAMQSAKLSMHSSGLWRWAMTEPEATRQQLGADQDRVMLRWSPPEPIGPGWQRAATIAIPASSIRNLIPEKKPRKGTVSYWTVEPGFREVWFDIFIQSANAPPIDMHNVSELVGRVQLPSGGAVWVVGTEWRVTKEREEEISRLRKISRDFYISREGPDSFNAMKNPTASNWGYDNDDGRPIVIDLGDLRAPTASGS
jgi:hypothetical protein